MVSSQIDPQARLNAMLRWGVALSIVWLAGIGSLIALYLGVRAQRMIAVDPNLHGSGRARWCIVVGAIGVVLFGTLLVVGVLTPHSV
ncbi:MAG TPA: hypothetical protein VMF58_11360 [Rhizomicrobium sp.]|nr:hypothetical protein [Rhizomicrobium sp.]